MEFASNFSKLVFEYFIELPIKDEYEGLTL
jgi:hypothetical protein